MSDVVIRIENLGKRYRYGGPLSVSYNLRQDITDWVKGLVRRHETVSSSRSSVPNDQQSTESGHKSQGVSHPAFREVHERHLDTDPNYFWALKSIDLEIAQGEVVGIIGRNGAGKSTLLKILSRITPPTTGKITYYGRVASLLEVGTGFHRELTGRENVFLNGSILGMKRGEIAKKFDEIVAFAEVEKFIDTPVKFYSSGMYVRLAFAVAAHLEPEILIVDEVLAVGDAEFQRKCLGKMEEVAKQGRTVLFVSHNLGAISALCEAVTVLDCGRLAFRGAASDAIRNYLSQMRSTSLRSLSERTDREGTGETRITRLTFVDTNGQLLQHLVSGYACMLLIGYEGFQSLRQPRFRCTVYNSVGQPLVHFDSSIVRSPWRDLPKQGTIACRFPCFPLSEGSYRANVSLEDSGRLLDHLTGALTFVVCQGNLFGAGQNITGIREVCFLPQDWLIVNEDALTSPGSNTSK